MRRPDAVVGPALPGVPLPGRGAPFPVFLALALVRLLRRSGLGVMDGVQVFISLIAAFLVGASFSCWVMSKEKGGPYLDGWGG